MRKLIATILLLALLLCGCQAPADESKQLKIICTGFAAYDWVRQIVGEEDAQLTLMASNNADLHSYQATVADLAAIADCDLFIYIGGASDLWATQALENEHKEGRKTLALLEALPTIEAEQHRHHTHEAYEEHVWLSLPRAIQAVDAICTLLEQADPSNAAQYRANADRYCQQLSALDQQYRATVRQAPTKTLIFADRFPFRYLVEDYGLTHYAAFSGCSAETEASFSTIAFLAEKLEELKLPAVLVLENADPTIARTVIANTSAKNQQILTLDSIQAENLNRVTDGQTYLSVMENNLRVLSQALGV